MCAQHPAARESVHSAPSTSLKMESEKLVKSGERNMTPTSRDDTRSYVSDPRFGLDCPAVGGDRASGERGLEGGMSRVRRLDFNTEFWWGQS